MAFGVSVTPHPENAGEYANGELTVTVVDGLHGYPQQGSIRDYFAANFPKARLDILEVSKPEELKSQLQSRIDGRDRFGHEPEIPDTKQEDDEFRLLWPTDYYSVIQGFGANPEIYAQWGLPGHEGLDIRAPYNSNVYACAAGKVMDLDQEQMGHAISLAVVPNLSLGQTRVGELSMWKGCAGPNGTRAGIFAAQLAEQGMTGPFEPFDGSDGMW
ncbi:MAG: MmgE/PrpD family protein, partial [Chloroflexi bacterium]|nr:MmgE/PrpD family protein [Chloroflexota bacterium]